MESKEKDIDWNKGTIYGKYSKYEMGDKIETLEELLTQEVFIWCSSVRNKAWLLSQQLRWVLTSIVGHSYKCRLKKKDNK